MLKTEHLRPNHSAKIHLTGEDRVSFVAVLQAFAAAHGLQLTIGTRDPTGTRLMIEMTKGDIIINAYNPPPDDPASFKVFSYSNATPLGSTPLMDALLHVLRARAGLTVETRY